MAAKKKKPTSGKGSKGGKSYKGGKGSKRGKPSKGGKGVKGVALQSAKRSAKRGASKAVRSFSRPGPGEVGEQKGSWFFSERTPGVPKYWLLKQEPTDFSFEDLLATPSRTTNWNGVRNFLARSFLRDRIKTGDKAFFYHSNANPSAVVGIVDIVRDGYPDHTALDPKSPYYDADATPADPRWFQVDVRAVAPLPRPVSIAEIKTDPALAGLVLLHISQLSVQPVTKAEWDAVLRLAAGRPKP